MNRLKQKAVRTYLIRPGLKVKRIKPASRRCRLIRINLIGGSRKVSNVAALDRLRKLWEADSKARSVYAEYQWQMLQAGAPLEDGEVHLLGMFEDRTVRRRFDKQLRDAHARRDRPHTHCFSCRKKLVRLRRGRYVPTASRHPRLCGGCRGECRPIGSRTVGNPIVRIGSRSLKVLTQKLGGKHRRGAKAIKVPSGLRWEWKNEAGYVLVKKN